MNDKRVLRLESVVLRNQVSPPDAPRGQATLDIIRQGIDSPGALPRLTAPFARRRINLAAMRYSVFGAENKFFEAQMFAEGDYAELSAVSTEIEENPVCYSFAAEEQLLQTTPVMDPWFVDFKVALFDKPGLVDEWAVIPSDLVSPGVDLAPNGEAICLTGSIAVLNCWRFEVPSRLFAFHAECRNDAGFAEGGTPGFVIQARIAAPTGYVKDFIVERLKDFCRDRGQLGPVQIHHIEHIEQDDSVGPVGPVHVPIQFLLSKAA